MRDGAIERINAASLGGNRSTPSNAARMPKLLRKAISVSLPKKTSSRNITRPISAIGTGYPSPGARTGKRFEETLPPFAHLADASGAPPYMGLRVDQD